MLWLLAACTFYADDKVLPPGRRPEDSTVLADDSDPDSPDDSGKDTGILDPTGWPRPVFAPYVDATAYPTPKLVDIYEATGTAWFALGFIVDETGHECVATWGTYYSVEEGPVAWEDGAQYTLYEHIARLRVAGGDVMVSFGGAANTDLATACTDVDALAAQYQSVIDTLELRVIDFDIEGAALLDVGPGSATQRRARAIARVQEQMDALDRPLQVWLTLPVLPTGLTSEGLTVLKDTLREGVKLAGVNVMTMDYGDGAAPDPAGQMGQYGTDALTALQAQLATAMAEQGEVPSDAALWRMVGTTPMIGQNDVASELFTLSDARLTLDFVRTRGAGRLSMWSVNRDHPCPESTSARTDCSSTAEQTEDWAYTAIFQPLSPPPGQP